MLRENILRVFVASTILLAAAIHSAGQPEEPKHINVTASKFSFAPSEITVKKGEPIVLTLSSTDANHGLVIKQLGIHVEVHKGQSVDIPISTNVAGTFEGKCAHFCGKGHGSMIFAVHVVD